MNPFYEQFKAECLSGEGIGRNELGPFYKGVLYQRGYGLGYEDICPEQMYGLGIGDSLSNLFQMAWPAVKKGLQYLGKTAVNTAANIATDAIRGKDVRAAAKEHASQSAAQILAKAPAALSSHLGIREAVAKSSGSRKSAVKRKGSKPRPGIKKFGKGVQAAYPLLNQL